MAVSEQPFQTHGFQTSVDIARRQSYVPTTLAGVKRPRQGIDIDQGVGEDGGQEPSGDVGRAELSDRTHRNHHNKQKDNLDDIPSKQRAVDFVRASSATHRPRIAASEIRAASGAVPAGHLPPEGEGAPSTPSTTQNPLLSLQHPRYGLPPALVANFAALGIDTIYPWQASCLLGRGHLTGEKNLLYSAPTGGGKSLVADVLMLKRVIENPQRKAILVLPYVALVQEKLKWLRRVVQDVEKNVADKDDDQENPSRPTWRRKQQQKTIRVTGFFGGSKSRSTWSDTDIAVCTIEKVRC
jgi:hypothetical protein